MIDAAGYAWTVLKNNEAFVSGSGATFAFTPDAMRKLRIGLTVSDKDGAAASTFADDQCGQWRRPDHCQYQRAAGGRQRSSRSRARPAIRPAPRHAQLRLGRPQGRRGLASGSGATFAFTPDENAGHEIGLTVSDEDGASTTVPQTVSVANVATARRLSVSARHRSKAPAITVTGSASDPAGAALDTLSYSWTILKGGVNSASGSGTTFAFTPDAMPVTRSA